MSETVNSNLSPGHRNDLVDLVGEVEVEQAPDPKPKKRAAKKVEK